LGNDSVQARATELAITELRYVLCRKLGWRQSAERAKKLVASGYFKVEETPKLMNEAARIKCRMAISLADCFTLALAQEIGGSALFARNEQDLSAEMARKAFEATIVFLEE
jgi:predicted nucleic acid-binding protein